MSDYKLAATIKSTYAPHDPWTQLIVDCLADRESGKLRLDYGTGRQAISGPKAAIQQAVYVVNIDDRTLYAVGDGHERLAPLAADEVSRRFVKVSLDVFKSYQIKKKRKSGRGGTTRQARRMWFRLVACDVDGTKIDEAILEHTRDARERIVGHGRERDDLDEEEPDDDDGDDIATSGSSRTPEQDFTRVLLRERAEDRGIVLTCAERYGDLAKLATEQTRTMAEAFDGFAERMEGFMLTSLKVHSGAVETHAAAEVARMQAEAQSLIAEQNSAGFWETATGQMVGGQIGSVAERLFESVSDPEKVSDFLGRVVAKGFSAYEQFKRR